MTIRCEDIMALIDAVGDKAVARKRMLEKEYVKATGNECDLPLNWYRSKKNYDLKDALTLEGIKRGFSVRAEKIMGALPEYCDVKDQKEFNRFDLSWEKQKDSRDFSLAVEIEMDIDVGSIMRDFHKLINNSSDCLKVMICQARYEEQIGQYRNAVESALSVCPSKSGSYMLSIWAWSRGGFVHYQY